jgi:hypothetical protein
MNEQQATSLSILFSQLPEQQKKKIKSKANGDLQKNPWGAGWRIAVNPVSARITAAAAAALNGSAIEIAAYLISGITK